MSDLVKGSAALWSTYTHKVYRQNIEDEAVLTAIRFLIALARPNPEGRTE